MQGTRVARAPAWALAVTAMLAVQLSAALSVGLTEQVGPAGTAWLRLTMGALLFIVVARPPLRSLRRADVPVVLGLGTVTAVMTLAFLASLERIPLGTAVAIEFLGPLSVAAIGSRRRTVLWPLLALVGVILLTEPWQGAVDPLGVALAALAGAGWGTYILLTRRIGDRFEGVQGLAMTIPVAAIVAAFVGVPQAAGHLTPLTLLWALGLALLMPLLAFALELGALRRMTQTAFGTLMAVEPGIGLVLGLIVLGQVPNLLQVAGIAVVIAAGVGAQIGGSRKADAAEASPHPPALPS